MIGIRTEQRFDREHPKQIAIFGSTGSIGTQALDVVDELGIFRVATLVCKGSNIWAFAEQIKKYKPEFAVVIDEDKFEELKRALNGTSTVIETGLEAAIERCTLPHIQLVLNATVGFSGLVPTLKFIESHKDVALANKETMVAGGELVMNTAKHHRVRILPVDSEPSAIFQCLQGNSHKEIENIYLTASGGPFRLTKREDLDDVTPTQALRHPTWRMGKKVTIDSATLMNKGLEVIEISWLFGVPSERIKIMIHPGSKVHSAVEFVDGSILAQLGTPNMRTPIQYALTHPFRIRNNLERLDLINNNLAFEAPDVEKFECLSLAREALKIGGTMPVVLNAANEIAVENFLGGRIRITDIAKVVRDVMNEHSPFRKPRLADIIDADGWARDKALERSGTKKELARCKS